MSERSEVEELWADAADEDAAAAAPRTCGMGHRSSLSLETGEGGAICVACFSALACDPRAPSHHVSHALSQLSLALRSRPFLAALRSRGPHLLVPPLVRSLANAPDDALARQANELIADLCGALAAVSADFVARVADLLSSRALAWTRRQVYTLHCLGLLLDSQQDGNPTNHIRNKAALFSNLVSGLQLPSEEIRGEILFVLYKLAIHQATPWDESDDVDSDLLITMERLVGLSLEALLKTQQDDVRMNCVALLMVFAQRGLFHNLFANDQTHSGSIEAKNSMPTDKEVLTTPLIYLFTDAIKGPLLSSDTQVQISTLDLIFHTFASGMSCVKQIQALVEESIADYVFEILRTSANKDPLVISCLQVLDLLAIAESFRHRLAIGFPILLSILHYVAETPLHPVQSLVLKLVWSCISDCPGIVSISQVEEIMLILVRIFRRHNSGDIGMASETFTLACSTFVEILKSPSANHVQKLTPIIQDASKYAVLSSLSAPHGHSNPLVLYSLYVLKEAHIYSHEERPDTDSDSKDLENSIIKICETHLLPWFRRVTDEGEEEEILLGILEMFHVILLGGTELQARKFAETLASSSWFSLSFGCLGLFPSDRMRTRVYLMLSSIIDRVFGPDFGKPIRDCYFHLPSDPLELIYLLGLRSSHDSILTSCQSAVVLMLYVSSLFGESLADDNQVLASLEQYILMNSGNFSSGIADSMMMTQLVHLYGFVRGSLVRCRTPYSPEAEKALLHLVTEKEWGLLSIGIHPIALKWLFQQEGIMTSLSNRILEFCRFYSGSKTQINVHANIIQIIDIKMVAQLVVAGDNCVMLLLVSLLKQAQEEGSEDDMISVFNAMATILNIFPDASNEFCMHDISNVLRCVYHSTHTSPQIFMTCSLLVFNVLYSANPETLTQGGDWLAVTAKLLESLNSKLISHTCGEEGYLIMCILSLILHHSTNQALIEASKAILLNTSLASAIDNVMQTACAKGPSLAHDDEETKIGESLIFVLLVYFFSLKSLQAICQEVVDWQDFLQTSDELQLLPVLCIPCHDLCRLIYFGSFPVKIVASECLLELLTSISDQRIKKHDDLKCSTRYLESMIAVIEGLLFCGDSIVATNCAICLSIILGWDKLGLKERRVIRDSKWGKLIIEELALTLAAPGLASKSFMNQHKPVVHVAIACLRLNKLPGWMSSVFDKQCISGIIDNLSATNVSPDMVKLFRELMAKKFLCEEQVSSLHHLFQICRKHVYKGSRREQVGEEYFGKGVAATDDLGKACSLLIHLMLTPAGHSIEMQTEYKTLLEEIDLFFQESCTQ